MDNEQTATAPKPEQYPENLQQHDGQNMNNNGPDGEQMMDDDNQQYKPMDLTPYEDDSDETLHWKLVAAKQERKKAEADLKLLCNRISLLKQEESKVIYAVLKHGSNCYSYSLNRRSKKSRRLGSVPTTFFRRDKETKITTERRWHVCSSNRLRLMLRPTNTSR